ncbi:COP9 signalosome complex subunit 8-like [Macrosteles quadrilineatus]|uniref:COP9 signalosome complex subunit 8-like n=1 Tax=Macrosteles quadrilineatus TaxID=74068 RepID=UPI0023E0FEC3|nr:COP9 signalosome complex subunit 8-like [Macrosteles quadrilineatus]XP_054284823.1 COP9 signalosome complex subunit 8-like [Macrosteles quadrilineatus]
MVQNVDPTENFNAIANGIEMKELEADGSVTPQMYGQLLAIYLYQHDLCNAKYLWNRIPSQCKVEYPELNHIWSVGKAMWLRDYPGVYSALNSQPWSDNVAEIIKAVQQEVKKQATQLVCRAYTSVSLTTAAALMGTTPDAVAQLRDWRVEGNMVTPPKPLPSPPIVTSSEEQLGKLTDFVSFLEN